ncbi:DUF6387 family protein [Serratia fonticola]|uniref:DUF6387 family protein n=1 Tax=Serratia fonticola TaxID=47917 RepID=UPI00192D12E7|nr:DUF6387 family protein [Serratia fonticola]MBL5827666.1 hypothetical protein [Serratia fonticola]
MKINKKQNLPSWFKLSDYDCYKVMTDDEIVHQLSCRCNAMIVEEFKNERFFEDRLSHGLYVNADSSVMPVQVKSDCDKTHFLSKTSCISPLSVRDIKTIAMHLRETHNIDINGSVDDGLLDSYQHISAMDGISVIFDGFYCKVDILKQDDVIISELLKLIKLWRREIGVPDPTPLIKNSWSVVKDKIISYAIFPLIDLMMWEEATSNKITNGVLAVSLFPDGDYDAINIAQTIKPFVESVLDLGSIEKIEHEISNK